MKWTKTQRIEALQRQEAIENEVLLKYPVISEEQKCSTTKWFRDKMRQEYREKLEQVVERFIKVTPEMLKTI